MFQYKDEDVLWWDVFVRYYKFFNDYLFLFFFLEM